MSAKPKRKPKRKVVEETPIPGNAPTPVPRQINDRREDGAPVLGQFVDVISGPYEGRYGVFVELGNDGSTAIVRTRDSASERLAVPLEDLRSADAGRR